MNDESPDEIGPDRNTVQPAKAERSSKASKANAASKIPPERLRTAGSKVTHTRSTVESDADSAGRRAKKVVRPADERPGGDKATIVGSSADATDESDKTWVASGVATGFDGTKSKTGSQASKASGTADPDADEQGTSSSLFARDDEGQRSRPAEGSPHRSMDDAADDRDGTSSNDRSEEDRGSTEDRATDKAETSEDGDDDQVTPLRSAIEWIVAIGLAILAALFIKTFLLQAFVIPSGSMLPTLQDRDRVLVSKQTYRVVDIERGDVVVFDNPDWQPNEPEQLIKRVIGLPRDSVEAREGDLIVNGKILIEDYLGPDTITEDFPRTIVPDDAVFVMGDNRRNSKDSRLVGPIQLDDFTGHAFIRIWPPSRIGGL